MPPAGLLLRGVHGLPQLGVDPRHQLDSIRGFLASYPDLIAAYDDIVWSTGATGNIVATRRQMGAGIFGSTYAAVLDAAVRSLRPGFLLVVAFSAGGYTFYRWLVEHATATDRVAAVVIAGPHQCLEKSFIFEDDPRQRPIPFNDLPILPSQIAAKLRPGRLMVLLAEHDGTILRHNAVFPQTLVENGSIVQHVVPATRHGTVCDDTLTHQYLLQHISSL